MIHPIDLSSRMARRVLLLAAIAIAIHGCQQANEPNRTVTGVVVTALVVDQAGRPVPDAFVRYAPGANAASPLSQFERTDIEGKVSFVADVPTSGAVYTFEVEPPGNYSPQPLRRDSVFIPCQSSTIVFQVVRLANLPCGRSGSESLEISLCLDQETSRSALSALVTNNCPATVSFVTTVAPSLAGLPGLSISIVDPQGTALGNTFQRTPGQSFQVRCVYAPPATQEPATQGAVIVEGNDGQGNTTTYTVNLSATARICQSCPCPPEERIIHPAPPAYETNCVGADPKRVSVTLSHIANPSSRIGGCEYVYTLLPSESFRTGAFEAVSFNGETGVTTVLGPQQSLQPLVVLFAPKAAGEVIDSAVFIVRTRDQNGNPGTCPPRRLAVILRGLGGAGVCEIVQNPADTTLLRTTTNRLYQCIGENDPDQRKRLCIRNSGSCPITVHAAVRSQPGLFTVTPDSLVIDAGRQDCFDVTFNPTERTVWPNGRTSPAVKVFNDEILITGCATASIPLTGNAMTDCGVVNDMCLIKYGEANNKWRQGIVLDERSNVISKANEISTSQAYMWISDMIATDPNPANWRAQFNAPAGVTFYRITNRPRINSSEDICTWLQDYRAYCPDAVGLTPEKPITLGLYDVVLVKIRFAAGDTYCGLLWIKSFYKDALDPFGVPQVCFDLCYPF
jgi:hypothetical protein